MPERKPGIVIGSVLEDSIKEIVACLDAGKRWPAYLKTKQLVDSLFPFCCSDENGEPFQPKEGDLKLFKEFKDLTEPEAKKMKRSCRVQIDVGGLFDDLEEIRYQMEKKKYSEAKESLEGILVELEKLGSQAPGKTGSKYELKGEGEELALNSETGAGKQGEDKPMKESKTGDSGLSGPTMEDVEDLFKGKTGFKDREELIDVIYKGIKNPGVFGYDFADIRGIITKNSDFKLIKTFLNEIQEHQETIDSYSDVFFVFTGGPDDTLGFTESIIEKHFYRAANCMCLGGIDPNAESGNPKLEIILAKKRKKAQLMTTFSGNRKTISDFNKLLKEYNLQDKKLTEFSELDKAVYRDIKKFVKMI